MGCNVHVHNLNRIVLAALSSSMLFIGTSIPANGQQPPQQLATQEQQVVPDRIPPQPQQELTQYPPMGIRDSVPNRGIHP
jgi:hypothetical protein